MTNPLDPIWDAFQTVTNALKVVRRCTTQLPSADAERPLRNTRFHRVPQADCLQLLASAEERVEDHTVLGLCAAFETALRRHLAQQSQHFRTHANDPDAQFGQKLAVVYEDYCENARMDDIAALFSSTVGSTLVAQAGHIRQYRHWVAHGQRWTAPPPASARFAYETLTEFLRLCGLA